MNRSTRLTSSIAAVGALVAGFAADGDFEVVSAEIQQISIDGQPHAIIEVFADFSASKDTILNVFNADVSHAFSWLRRNPSRSPSGSTAFDSKSTRRR